MVASPNVSQLSESRKFNSGVRTLYGYGIRITVEHGHLAIEDGIGSARQQHRLGRIGHGLRRVVIVGADGYVTLSAVRWLAAQGISLVVLERDGEVFCATGRQGSSDARLRRAQARIPEADALRIAKQILDAKLSGQEKNARELLGATEVASVIAAHRLTRRADSISKLRNVESLAARAYWRAWHDIPVAFQKSDLPKVPAHWLTYGERYSALSAHSPRLAVTPAHACINYLMAVAESEAVIALQTLGLDPGLGILHADRLTRPSLALDLMEPVRPVVEAWALQFVSQPMCRNWYFERADGNVRLMAPLCRRLAETAPTWGRALAPWAEWLMQEIWKTCSPAVKKPPTRLTQSARRESKQRAT